jgi:hypothetical protein
VAVTRRYTRHARVAEETAIVPHDISAPNGAAILGRSATNRAFEGHAALQPASGAPPEITGVKRSQGTIAVKK